MRSVPEWRGTTDDTPVPPRVRARVFERYDGRCQCGCNRKIYVGERWDCDHRVALINGGEHREANLVPILTDHHKVKTAKDVAEKSASYRKRSKHIGVKPPSRNPLPCGRRSPWKKRMDGTVTRRDA